MNKFCVVFFRLRPRLGLHCLSSCRCHDACSSAVGSFLLHHDHLAGARQSGVPHFTVLDKSRLPFHLLALACRCRKTQMDSRSPMFQFVGLEALTTAISDLNPSFFHVGHRRKILLLAISVLCFLIGLVMVTDVRSVALARRKLFRLAPLAALSPPSCL